MDRWLVVHLSAPALALFMIAAFVVPGLVGIWVVRRWAPAWMRGLTNDVTGVVITVLAAIYGVVLAFAIVTLYEQFRDTDAQVHREASAAATLVRAAGELPAADGDALRDQVREYVAAVTGPEWRAMEQGRGSERADKELDDLYHQLGVTAPNTSAERVFFNRAVDALDDIVAARRERLSDARLALPKPFLVLLVGGGYLLLVFTLFFDVSDRRYHSVMVLSVAVLLGFSLMLCVALQYPFGGGMAVSDEPFHEGALRSL